MTENLPLKEHEKLGNIKNSAITYKDNLGTINNVQLCFDIFFIISTDLLFDFIFRFLQIYGLILSSDFCKFMVGFYLQISANLWFDSIYRFLQIAKDKIKIKIKSRLALGSPGWELFGQVSPMVTQHA